MTSVAEGDVPKVLRSKRYRPTGKAALTFYKGIRFRSRTEVRWAVFMDNLGVRYVYEKNVLANRTWDLPRFWLPEQNCYLMVLSADLSSQEKNIASFLAYGLAIDTGKDVCVFRECGPQDRVTPEEYDGFLADVLWESQGYRINDSGEATYPVEFGCCPQCDKIQIDYPSDSPLACGCNRNESGLLRCCGFLRHPRVAAAYEAANSVRFGRRRAYTKMKNHG